MSKTYVIFCMSPNGIDVSLGSTNSLKHVHSELQKGSRVWVVPEMLEISSVDMSSILARPK